MSYGTLIRELRQKSGLTQKQLGLKCGYKESSAERTVQHWEHDRQEPSIRTIRKLAKALQVSIENLIPDDED